MNTAAALRRGQISAEDYSGSGCWGASDYSARLAAKPGFPFAFAAHLVDQNVMTALDICRRHTQTSAVLDSLYVMASFGLMVADDEPESRAFLANNLPLD